MERIMKNKIIINILKIVGFMAALSLCIGFSFNALVYKDTGGGGGFERLENLPDDSADVIFFGNSHCHCTIDHGYLWDNYGIAGFTFSAGNQQIDSTASFVEYALSQQHPKVVAVEISGVFADCVDSDYVDVYRNLVGMDYSFSYVDRALTMAKTIGDTADRKFELLTKYPLVHSRYREFTREDFELDLPYMMGYRGSMETEAYARPSVEEWTAVNPIPEDVLAEVDKIVDLTNKNDVELIFFASPFIIEQNKQERFNAFEEYAAKNNLIFINYNNMYDELGMDFGVDFRDPDHVNNRGAAKVTGAIAEVLNAKFNLQDRRGDEKYKAWDMNSRYLQNKSIRNNLSPEVDFNTYMNALNLVGDRYLIIIKMAGDYMSLPEMYASGLEDCGVTQDIYSNGGCVILKNGKFTEQLTGDYSRCISTPNEEINIDSQKNRFLIDGVKYVLPKDGIGVMVYDLKLGYLVDVALVDVYQDGNVVKHASINM